MHCCDFQLHSPSRTNGRKSLFPVTPKVSSPWPGSCPLTSSERVTLAGRTALGFPLWLILVVVRPCSICGSLHIVTPLHNSSAGVLPNLNNGHHRHCSCGFPKKSTHLSRAGTYCFFLSSEKSSFLQKPNRQVYKYLCLLDMKPKVK